MSKDITRVTADDLVQLLNINIRQHDKALDDGVDAYKRWVAWRAQFATSALAAADLVAKGDAWVTEAIIDRWGSAYENFNHLQMCANGADMGVCDCYAEWDKIFN